MRNFFTSLMSISSAEDGGVSLFGSIFRWAIIAVITVVLAIAVIAFVDLMQEFSSKPDLMKIGAIGDFIGGILNPLLAFLVLLVLLATTRLQREELSATKNELYRSAGAAEQQVFESTFFGLLRLINENVKSASVSVSAPRNSVDGTEAFQKIYKALQVNSKTCGPIENLFPKIYLQYRHILGNYIRLIYWTLNFLQDYEDKNNDINSTYGKILRAQLSDHELAIIFYNCLSKNGESFLPLAKRFDLFNSLSADLVFHEAHFELLKSKYDALP